MQVPDIEGDVNPCANFQPGKKFGDWMVRNKLDEGGFGQVYRVENVKSGKVAALKAEPNDVEGGSAIKLEMWVLRQMVEGGEKPHVPLVYHAAKHRKFCYMVMMLLGDNLKHLRIRCPRELMTPNTWARIAIQCLYGIKMVHDYGFIHRDIKPNNFVIGHQDDPERSRIVHILDFGLTRPYASKVNGKWVAKRARGTAEFRGTLRYCSPNVHERKEQGRCDDLWSLLYVLIEFHCGLPWQKTSEKLKVENMKMCIDDRVLMQNMPLEMLPLIPHLRTLNCYQRPDYSLFYNQFKAMLKKYRVNHWDPYDWETREEVADVRRKMVGRLPEWETNGAEFFKSDPIGIHGPPPPKEKKSKDKRSTGDKSKMASMAEDTASKMAGGSKMGGK